MRLYLFNHYDNDAHALVVAETLESAWELSGLADRETWLYGEHRQAELRDFDLAVFEITAGLVFEGWGNDCGDDGISKEKGAEPIEVRKASWDEMTAATVKEDSK